MIDRRELIRSAAALAVGGALSACARTPDRRAAPAASASEASASEASASAQAALARFAALPVEASALVEAGDGTGLRLAHRPDQFMFVGSAIKTFVLAQFLREVEAGRLSEDAPMTVDDAVRTPGSPVLLGLTGSLPARSVLEAMITHSDNVATDLALAAATPASVRTLIAEAGLAHTRIPDSTRRFFSWIGGAAKGVDIGWDGMQRMDGDWKPGTPRDALNDEQTLAGTASDFVRWYRAALAGRYFAKPDTLREFRRIQAMADALALVVPAGIAAWGKGGSIDWEDFHCFCLPGQMIVREVPVTFCFTINWRGPQDGVAPMFERYRDAVAGVLAAVADGMART